jgi:hypothetical protein
MLSGYEGTVHCDKCRSDIPAGKYCKACNRFLIPGEATCCGQNMPKGSFCTKCKKYVGLPNMAFCEKCKAPYDKATGCCGCKPACEGETPKKV